MLKPNGFEHSLRSGATDCVVRNLRWIKVDLEL